MVLSFYSTPAYWFFPDEGSCNIFLTQNNYTKLLASYGANMQSGYKPGNRHKNKIYHESKLLHKYFLQQTYTLKISILSLKWNSK